MYCHGVDDNNVVGNIFAVLDGLLLCCLICWAVGAGRGTTSVHVVTFDDAPGNVTPRGNGTTLDIIFAYQVIMLLGSWDVGDNFHCRMMTDIGGGLWWLHNSRLVHLDCKPDNLLVRGRVITFSSTKRGYS